MSQTRNTFIAAMVAISAIAVLGTRAEGQILRGRWVVDAEERINQHRKTDLHVLVLDKEGAPVADARVHLEMLRHAFAFGIHLPAEAFADDTDLIAVPLNAPVWRCFNSIALDNASAWPQTQTHRNAWDFRPVDRMLEWADTRGMTVRWGPVTSANPDRAPVWLNDLDDGQFRGMIEKHIRRVMKDYGRRVDQFDLHADLADHKLVQARLGIQMIRNMHEMARAQAPAAKICARFENSIHGNRIQPMLQTVAMLQDNFVPVDMIVFDERIHRTVLQAPLAQAMQWINAMGLPVVIGRLEVGGASPTAAAVNLETLLRILFAEPAIEGIWIAGVGPDQVEAAHAALLDENGELTPAGVVFEGLVRKRWWTDVTITADDLGNVRARVFAGRYRISATLPDGSTAETEVYLPVAQRPRTVVLQPIGVAAAPAPGTNPPLLEVIPVLTQQPQVVDDDRTDAAPADTRDDEPAVVLPDETTDGLDQPPTDAP